MARKMKVLEKKNELVMVDGKLVVKTTDGVLHTGDKTRVDYYQIGSRQK